MVEEEERKEEKCSVAGIVRDGKVMNFSASIPFAALTANPQMLRTSPHAHCYWPLREKCHQPNRNTRQNWHGCNITRVTLTDPIFPTGDLLPRYSLLIFIRKGLTQPRCERPKQPYARDYCCRLIGNTSQELNQRA